MPLIEVFHYPEIIRYRSHIFSKATVFQFLFTSFIFVGSFLSVYRSQGFWDRTLQMTVKPQIRFQYKMIVNVMTSSNAMYSWSTYSQYNQLQQQQLTIPLISTREVDDNLDGKADRLLLNATFSSMQNVQSVQILLFFDYLLNSLSTLETQAIGFIQYASPVIGSAFYYTADLILQQNVPLPAKGVDVTTNTSIIPSNSLSPSDYDMKVLLAKYAARNNTVTLTNVYPFWLVGSSVDQTFSLYVTINYPTQFVTFYAPFWYMVKWAWIQYVAILYIFVFFIQRIKVFVFQNQLFSTVVERPKPPSKTL